MGKGKEGLSLADRWGGIQENHLWSSEKATWSHKLVYHSSVWEFPRQQTCSSVSAPISGEKTRAGEMNSRVRTAGKFTPVFCESNEHCREQLGLSYLTWIPLRRETIIQTCTPRSGKTEWGHCPPQISLKSYTSPKRSLQMPTMLGPLIYKLEKQNN